MYRVLQRKLALIRELQNGERCEGLGRRADAELSVCSCSAAGGYIRFPEPCNPLGTVAVHNRDGHAWRVRVVEDLFQLLLEFWKGLRRLGRVLFFVLSETGGGEEAEQHEPSYGFHAAHSPLEGPTSASG